MASEPGDKVLHFDFVLHGRLLDNNSHRCESLADLAYPIVLLQGGESGSDCFIECLRGDLYGVLNVSGIFYRNCARSQDHKQSVAYSPFVRYGRQKKRGNVRFGVCSIEWPEGLPHEQVARLEKPDADVCATCSVGTRCA